MFMRFYNYKYLLCKQKTVIYWFAQICKKLLSNQSRDLTARLDIFFFSSGIRCGHCRTSGYRHITTVKQPLKSADITDSLLESSSKWLQITIHNELTGVPKCLWCLGRTKNFILAVKGWLCINFKSWYDDSYKNFVLNDDVVKLVKIQVRWWGWNYLDPSQPKNYFMIFGKQTNFQSYIICERFECIYRTRNKYLTWYMSKTTNG